MGNQLGKSYFKKVFEKREKKEGSTLKRKSESEKCPEPDHATEKKYKTLSSQEYVRAVYSYAAQNPDDLSFNKDDLLSIISKQDDPWWLAEHSVTKSQGFIPKNYVVVDDGRPSSLQAWFDVSSSKAHELLMKMGNPSGTYIVRPSDAGNFAISVRYSSSTNFWEVRKYRVNFTGDEYYITKNTRFALMGELVRYYATQPGLCCHLTQPCPKVQPPVQFRDLEVARHSIHFVKPLGHGCFGEVFQAKWTNVLDVAVKQLKTDGMGSIARSQFIQEAQVMHKLRHENIVQILGVCTEPDNEPCLIITELMINGSLLDFLRKGDGRQMDFNELLVVIGQVAQGMTYLERLNFVHRDLRAANILVGENNVVKVADFGLSRCMEDEEVYSGNEETKFPVKWTAIEALTKKIFSTKSDVWSFGVLIYEVITYGSPPYEGMNNYEVKEKVVKEGYRMPNPDGKCVRNKSVFCPEELYEIMRKCWDETPEHRYTFEILCDLFDDYMVQVMDTLYPEM